jgi:hypothetical protein
MRERKEQINEEFAKELINNITISQWKEWRPVNIEATKYETFKNWKQKGYIKQSREEKIRGELKELDDGNIPFPNYEYYYFKAIELIEILDNKE